jgi:hypothetical protein
MKFIRKNLFYVCLVAGTVAASALLMLVHSSLADNFDNEAAARKELSGRLKQFVSPDNRVNERIVAAATERGRLITEEANRAIAAFMLSNRAAYPVLSVEVGQGSAARVVSAFPYDANVYRELGVTLPLIRRHREVAGERIRALHPTQPPSGADIEMEARALAQTAPPAVTDGPAALAVDAVKLMATDYAVIEKARQGYIYVDSNALLPEISFRPSDDTADEAVLWQKQYKLWIATDLIAAFKAANDEVFKGLGPHERNAGCAAVKRWVMFSAQDKYFAKTESGAPVGDSSRTESIAAGISGDTLTRHYTDQDKDVVLYSFSVVMPTRHAPLLMRKLMQGRLHTVLSFKAEDANNDGRYYYSNDPVMQVTFTCEAIFMTSWERPLIPPGFLKTLPASALREEDKARLPKQ